SSSMSPKKGVGPPSWLPLPAISANSTCWSTMPASRAAPKQDFYNTEAWHRIMAVNATRGFFCIKHAISALIGTGGGGVLTISSIAGIIGSEHVHIAYNASKAAVRLMTKWVAVQHGKDNIRANSVHPGIMPRMRTSGRTADPAVRAE